VLLDNAELAELERNEGSSMLPEAIRRPMLPLLGTRPVAKTLRWALPLTDRFAVWASRGRRTFTELMMPTLVLTTTGRRSGEPREQPLLYLPEGEGLVVVGSNFGQRHHPAWTHNLLATPEASVRIGGTTSQVRAELVAGEERERLYRRFEHLSPNYPLYREWCGDREIRVFRLHPA
jgi:deazaflavin-dependent oxidoreductase (nitroreductase family)